MKCPVCSVDLSIADRQGIEIDYCPKCRGVWLDRGELDKLIDRSMQIMPQPTQPPPVQRPDARYEKEYYNDPSYYKKHKRKSLLGEIFDFD